MTDDLKAMARLATAVGYIAQEIAQAQEETGPEALVDARRYTESVRDRLIGVASELRGIDCDFECIARELEKLPGEHRHHWAYVDADLGPALVRVVDLITTVQFGLDRLAKWEPPAEPESEAK